MFVLESLRDNSSFELDPSVFLARSISLARASELAYDDAAAVVAEALDLPSVTTFDVANVQGFWFVDNHVALLVFRGSANKRHWLDNFRILSPKIDNHEWGMAHPGFLASIGNTTVVEQILTPFVRAAAGQPNVWLAGHSLGGALAVLTASWLKREAKIDCFLHTYGQPMPGFENFCQRFDYELPGSLTRFINQRDIVARMPGVQYRHCGKAKTITSAGTLQKLGASPAIILENSDATPASRAEFEAFLDNLDSLEDTAFATAQLQGLITSRIPWFAHHSITRYILELQAIQRILQS